ncbi:MAG TPA: trypsin-like serine protease [Euzebyales bacterium]
MASDVRTAQVDHRVVTLVSAGSITDNGDGTSTLSGPTFGDDRDLCSTEPFREQPTIAFCTGFLVDPSLVATAAHCVNDASLANVRFGKVPDNAAVHVIGHPSGLPKKYAPGAVVRDNAPTRFFRANLDTYGGNCSDVTATRLRDRCVAARGRRWPVEHVGRHDPG